METRYHTGLKQFACTLALLLGCGVMVWGCGSDGAEEARKAFEESGTRASLPEGHPPIEAPPEAAAPSSAPSPNEVAGMAWTVPEHWDAQGARAMRAATYTIHTNREGTAECAVFFFGQGQGGDVEANINRWINQFQQPDGTPSSERATSSRSVQSGWPVTRVEVAGTYTAGMGPGQAQEPQAGYRLLGAIIEGPEGAVFFKLTGPEMVVDESRDEFDALLASIRPVS